MKKLKIRSKIKAPSTIIFVDRKKNQNKFKCREKELIENE